MDLFHLQWRAVDIFHTQWRAVDLFHLQWRTVDIFHLQWRTVDSSTFFILVCLELSCFRMSMPVASFSKSTGSTSPSISPPMLVPGLDPSGWCDETARPLSSTGLKGDAGGWKTCLLAAVEDLDDSALWDVSVFSPVDLKIHG